MPLITDYTTALTGPVVAQSTSCLAWCLAWPCPCELLPMVGCLLHSKVSEMSTAWTAATKQLDIHACSGSSCAVGARCAVGHFDMLLLVELGDKQGWCTRCRNNSLTMCAHSRMKKSAVQECYRYACRRLMPGILFFVVGATWAAGCACCCGCCGWEMAVVGQLRRHGWGWRCTTRPSRRYQLTTDRYMAPTGLPQQLCVCGHPTARVHRRLCPTRLKHEVCGCSRTREAGGMLGHAR